VRTRLRASLLLALAACATMPKPESVPLLQLPDDVRPVRYSLEMKIDPSQPKFNGKARSPLPPDGAR
jgi:cytosol alanyl aminopeptidase